MKDNLPTRDIDVPPDPGSLTIVANCACEESQRPCTFANCRAQDLFPIGRETFLECADSAHCEAESSQQTFFQRGLE
jgi:hypothetical protein